MALENISNLKAWVNGLEVEEEAVEQLRNIAALPILAGHVAVMPDVHMGKGATVGSVIPTRAAIVPAAVGVDIGCGMCAVRTELRARDLPDSLGPIRGRIEAVVPVGFNAHESLPKAQGAGAEQLQRAMAALLSRQRDLAILDRIGRHDAGKVARQLGTLGGGNHFIELCLDETGAVWLMLHSGSRNIGKLIGEAAIGMAKDIALKADRRLADCDLAWLDEGTPAFDAYIEGMHWAQEYAALNRALMLHSVLGVLQDAFGRPVATGEHAVNCHHNFTRAEIHFGEKMWVTRKGAVSAAAGELGIIPGSMGAKSYIVRGKGHADAYCSCSHGAGRRMSRGAAKRQFSLVDLVAQTQGVECRKDEGVIDEIPQAYKDIDQVMSAQADLVSVEATLKQVLCVKG